MRANDGRDGKAGEDKGEATRGLHKMRSTGSCLPPLEAGGKLRATVLTDIPEGWGFQAFRCTKEKNFSCSKPPSLCNVLWQPKTLMRATLLPQGTVRHEGVGMILGRQGATHEVTEENAAAILLTMSAIGQNVPLWLNALEGSVRLFPVDQKQKHKQRVCILKRPCVFIISRAL